jgi:hypothetical protein
MWEVVNPDVTCLENILRVLFLMTALFLRHEGQESCCYDLRQQIISYNNKSSGRFYLRRQKLLPLNENSQPDVHRRFTPLIFPLWEKEHMEQVIFVSWSSKLSLLKGGHHSGAP